MRVSGSGVMLLEKLSRRGGKRSAAREGPARPRNVASVAVAQGGQFRADLNGPPVRFRYSAGRDEIVEPEGPARSADPRGVNRRAIRALTQFWAADRG